MTKGVFLVAFGKRGYIFSAYNMAYSIKHYNPDLPICLVHDGSIEWLNEDQRKIFDIKLPLPVNNGDPSTIKTSMYDLMPFDQTLFLDVDGLCLQNLDPVFDELEKDGGYYYTHVIDTHKIQQGRTIPNMIWAYADDIWAQYKLSEDAVMPCTNSSFQYIKKGDEAKALFEQIQKNLSDPIPLPKLRTQWGGSQPDELYLNVALAQKKITGKTPRPYMFLGYTIDPRPLHVLEKEYFILSTFGGKGFTRPKYVEYYDNLLIKMHRKDGRNHTLKHYIIVGDKHANTKPKKKIVSQSPSISIRKHHEKINLFISYYVDKNPNRQKEIETAIQKNLLVFDKIFLVSENVIPLTTGGIKIQTQKRPTYTDLFNIANENNDEDTISVIANADIFFNQESINAIKNVNFDNLAICLTRWNMNGGIPKEYVDKGSQDSWIFKGKIKGECNEVLGVSMCDHRVAYQLKEAGYKLANPSSTIKSFHLHYSKVRNYNVDGHLEGGKSFVERSDYKEIEKKKMLIVSNDEQEINSLAKQHANEFSIDVETELQIESDYFQVVKNANQSQYQKINDEKMLRIEQA